LDEEKYSSRFPVIVQVERRNGQFAVSFDVQVQGANVSPTNFIVVELTEFVTDFFFLNQAQHNMAEDEYPASVINVPMTFLDFRISSPHIVISTSLLKTFHLLMCEALYLYGVILPLHSQLFHQEYGF
jgi:hypothetical protein